MESVTQPSGTVTLVFTDVEGSTRLLGELGETDYLAALTEHREVVRGAFGRHGGYEVDAQGDSFFYAFASATEAVRGVSEAMAALDRGPIAIRVGVHTGEPGLDGRNYVGLDIHTAARIMAAGHGGQVLLSQTTRGLLDDSFALSDLGEHRLKDFEKPQWIFQLGGGRFAPLRTVANTNLPRPASSFIGREPEVAEIMALLRGGSRLVTLSGPGGSGKTRLAIASAANLGPEYLDGVFWVDLSAVRDPLLVMDSVAETIGAKERLARHIGERNMLLVLDNFEQVVDAAPQLSALLRDCGNLSLLVTSRELLRVEGEVQYRVLPLRESEAVELFCERGQLEPDDAVASLCRRLDDLPLAVELAAARTTVMSPAEILSGLSDRLDSLRGGRDAAIRQRTLRATIGWSHDLLSFEEQSLFARLSVFAGGFTLDSAVDVCDAEVDRLQSLTEKSLLLLHDERFRMLETVGDFAAEQLDGLDSGSWKERHAEHFTALAEAADLDARRSDQPKWLSRLDNELGNLRAALAFTRGTGLTDLELRLVTAFAPYWFLRGHFEEGERGLALALIKARGSPPTARLPLLGYATHLAMRRGELTDARRFANERLELADQLDNALERVLALIHVGVCAVFENRLDEAERYLTTAVQEAKDLGGFALPTAEMNLGWAWLVAGNSDPYSLLEDAVRNARKVNNPNLLSTCLTGLAAACRSTNQLESARLAILESIQLLPDAPNPEALVDQLLEAAALLSAEDRTLDAARLFVAAMAIGNHAGYRYEPWLQLVYNGLAHTLETSLGAERFATANEMSAMLRPHEASALAIQLLTTDIAN